MRDETDNWNYEQLEKFKACPVVNVRRVEQIAQGLVIDEEKARHSPNTRSSWRKRPREENCGVHRQHNGHDLKHPIVEGLVHPFLLPFSISINACRPPRRLWSG